MNPVVELRIIMLFVPCVSRVSWFTIKKNIERTYNLKNVKSNMLFSLKILLVNIIIIGR